MYSRLFRSVIFPSMEYFSGTTIQKDLKQLTKSQWWSREDLVALQNSKLRGMIQHCWENVPYYSRMFRSLKISPNEIKTQEDLKKLPILTKDDIRRNASDLKAINVPVSRQIRSQSSGSTGEPIQYIVDKRSYSAGWAQTFRCWGWAGFDLGDPYVKISLNPRDSMKKKLQDKLLNTKYVFGSEIKEQEIGNFIADIKAFDPKIIRNYSSHMYVLAKMMESQDLYFSGATVTTTGDMLFSHFRKTIEERFRSKIFDAYGGESTPVAFECDAHDGYHICDEDVIVEFLQDSEHVSPLELGKIVITNLNNYAMPLIRYDLEDIGNFTEEKCICGRSLSRLNSIFGRDSDVVQTPSGDFVVVHFFTILFEYVEGIKQFQIIQESLDRIIVNLVINEKFSDGDYLYIKSKMQERMGPDVTIEYAFKDEIPVSGRSGKRRFVISHVPFK